LQPVGAAAQCLVLDWTAVGSADLVPLGPEHLGEVALAQVNEHRDAVFLQGHVPALGNDPLATGLLGLNEAFLVVLGLLDPVVVSGSINLGSLGGFADDSAQLKGSQERSLVLGQR